MTDHLRAMLESHPNPPAALETIRRCIVACLDCAAACTACANACLAERNVAELTPCIRLDLDCAELCTATGRIVGRLARPNKALLTATLQACIVGGEACATECARHADMHAHCRVCADACRDCARACQDLLDALP